MIEGRISTKSKNKEVEDSDETPDIINRNN